MREPVLSAVHRGGRTVTNGHDVSVSITASHQLFPYGCIGETVTCAGTAISP
jgi:hypothetical protein